MTRQLSAESTLDNLKKEAKRWLKSLRSGDAAARHRLEAAGVRSETPGLRDVQFALAREYGLAGWSALREALEELALAKRSQKERAEIVLRSASWGGDRVAAARVLAKWPEVGADSLAIAVMTGRLSEVERRIAADPGAAARKSGPLDWEPLLYLAYGRVAGGETNAVAIATALLDRGASATAQWKDDWDNAFTALTGVIGQGEGDQPPHPDAPALAALLIARGASAYDPQALYNTSITTDDVSWLDFLWSASERQGTLDRWRTIEPPTLGGSIRRSALDYLLGNAVAYGHLQRAEWLLQHGADPNTPHAYSKRPVREEALAHGHAAMAELLEKYGAAAKMLEKPAAFEAACMRLDESTARAMVASSPDLLRDATPMLGAARAGRVKVIALLLDLGMPVDVADASGMRALQAAVAANAIDIVQLLLAQGAEVDRPTKHYGGALGFAAHFGRHEIAALLAPQSRDVHNLTSLGLKERLGELFTESSSLANELHFRLGMPPLFFLPDDEDAAVAMTEFLLAHGADPRVRAKDGRTAEQAARQRGLEDAADLIAESKT